MMRVGIEVSGKSDAALVAKVVDVAKVSAESFPSVETFCRYAASVRREAALVRETPAFFGLLE